MKTPVFLFVVILALTDWLPHRQLAAAPVGPVSTPIIGCLQDYGENLSDETEKELLEFCAVALKEAKISLAIVTIPSLNGWSIEAYAQAIGNEWTRKDDYSGNGVIVLLSFSDRKIRIELDERAAKRMSDAKAKSIIETVFIPRFRQGQNDLGTTEGVQAIVDWFRLH